MFVDPGKHHATINQPQFHYSHNTVPPLHVFQLMNHTESLFNRKNGHCDKRNKLGLSLRLLKSYQKLVENED